MDEQDPAAGNACKSYKRGGVAAARYDLRFRRKVMSRPPHSMWRAA